MKESTVAQIFRIRNTFLEPTVGAKDELGSNDELFGRSLSEPPAHKVPHQYVAIPLPSVKEIREVGTTSDQPEPEQVPADTESMGKANNSPMEVGIVVDGCAAESLQKMQPDKENGGRREHKAQQRRQQSAWRYHSRERQMRKPLPIVQACSSSFLSHMIASHELWLGTRHAFHEECESMGKASEDRRFFTKVAYEGRLSLLSEMHIISSQASYLVRFTAGEISKADGVGFVFSKKLPCTKNIQKITSVFVNTHGQLCLRVQTELVKYGVGLKPLQIGDVIGMSINLQEKKVCFLIWPREGGPPATADFSYGEAMAACSGGTVLNKNMQGHFACIIKNVGVTVELLS